MPPTSQPAADPQTRVAFVTGASAGLGRATALRLARDGFDIAVSDLAVAMLEDLSRELEQTGRRVVPVMLDLRIPGSITAAIAQIGRALGRIDVLVNNAGRALQGPATEVTWSDWDDVIAINLRGAFFLSQALAREWIAAGRSGAIVNIASTHGLTGLAERSVYGISKGGLIQMTRMLAIEWAPAGIRVNAVAPATVLTPSRTDMLRDTAKRQRMLARIPLGRFPAAEEVAGAVSYLASADAANVTGHVLVLDGGLTAQ
jgi:NAD(P)-dependent dehydrogenase (short-subunit alcohol dehydrogenase family)